jgi:hypothetical protein
MCVCLLLQYPVLEEPGTLTQGGVLFSLVLSFGNRTQNSIVAGAKPNHQTIGGSDPNHQGIWSPPRALLLFITCVVCVVYLLL